MVHSADLVVLGVDDHVVYRRGLRMVLESSDPVIRVIEAASVAEALDVLRREPVSVVLLELAVCGDDTPGVVAHLVRSSLAPVVVFSKYGADDKVVAALQAGANGHVNETSDVDVFVAMLRRAAAGEYVLGASAVKSVVDAMRTYTQVQSSNGDHESLTGRETEILSLVCLAQTNRQIASRLGVSESTVKNHLQTVFRKLRVFSRAEAAAEAHRLGLLAEGLPCGPTRRQSPGTFEELPA